MNTGLSTDTLMGVQPTAIGNYMTTDFQQQTKECNTKYLGVHCNVSHIKKKVIDNESSLLGLDRLISKMEPPKINNQEPMTNTISGHESSSFKESYNFEPISTREKRANNVLSGIYIDRFEQNIHHVPQEMTRIVFDETTRGGLHTRTEFKDCKVEECGPVLKLPKSNYGNMCRKN